MMSVEDYDICNILGDSITSAYYKVKSKITGEIFVWRTIDYDKLSQSQYNDLLQKIKTRNEFKHPNLLQFHNFIDHKEFKILYIVTEFCENGNLQNIIDKKVHLTEELICRILYQIVSCLKTLKSFSGNLSTEEILLDDNFNVKLYNFHPTSKSMKIGEHKMASLGILLYELCSFKKFDKNLYEKESKLLSNTLYSSNLMSLITHMIRDSNDLKKSIDKILCHPSVLLKSSQWNKTISFHNNGNTEDNEEIVRSTEDEEVNLNIEKLRNYQASLKLREQKIIVKEHKLHKREKKIALTERIINDKLTQADLYLRRCREAKSISSSSTKSPTKLQYDDLNSTYSAECGDSSIIIPTSKKINVTNIIKPASFTRTMSERRIRFKGHSPLKYMNANKRKSPKVGKSLKENNKIIYERTSDYTSNSEISGDKSDCTKTICRKSKKLFSEPVHYENNTTNNVPRTISWTEDCKKQAFDLLRIMNEVQDKENVYTDIKHTYL